MALELQLRGKRNRQRGNAYEREVAKKLGGERTGQFGTKVDVKAGIIRAQTKNGTAYPERLDRWLREIPVVDGELATLVIGDAPGPGRQRRNLIVFDLDSFVSRVWTKMSHSSSPKEGK